MAAVTAAAAKSSDVELLSNDEISNGFANGGRAVEVTDLLTDHTFSASWVPYGKKHAHLWFPGATLIDQKAAGEPTRVKINGWSKNARPIVVTAIDDNEMTRNIAYGWVPYPHQKNWQEVPFELGSEMCIFNGYDVQGYGRDYGNEAAYGALNGDYHIFPLRPPKWQPQR